MDFVELVRRMQRRVLASCPHLLTAARDDTAGRAGLHTVVARALFEEGVALQRSARDRLAARITSEICGYGPIDPLIRDPQVNEIMCNGPTEVFIEVDGRLKRTDVRFRDEDHLMDIARRMVAPLGRRLDQSSPYVDARLPDGSRVNVIVPPLSLCGPVLTVRKFSAREFSLGDLIRLNTLSADMADFVALCVKARFNILFSGGTATGKTTTLNVLSAFIGEERVVTIEDTAELRLRLPHLVPLESRPPNLEGEGIVSIRDLVRNALRMRPDRMIIGEVRGAEAFDLLQALNTGHGGTLATIHANGPRDALVRLENMALMAGERVPVLVLRDQIRAAVDVIVHHSRFSDGSRKLARVSLVDRRARAGRSKPELSLVDVFTYHVERIDEQGRVRGRFRRCSHANMPPSFLERLDQAGLRPPAWIRGEEAQDQSRRRSRPATPPGRARVRCLRASRTGVALADHAAACTAGRDKGTPGTGK